MKHNLRTLLGALLLGAGVLSFQIHRGPAMKGHIKDVLLKELPEGGVVAFDKAALPACAAPAEKANGQPKRKARQQPKAGATGIE